MNCERKGCGHPLAVHDPCSVAGCGCAGYEPADRKTRVALLTDTATNVPTTRPGLSTWLKELKAQEAARLGHLK